MGVDDDFVKLVAFCRKNGIQSYKKVTGPVTLELQFHAAALLPESSYKKKKKDQESDHIPTEGGFHADPEAAIDWSSGGLSRND